MADERIDIADKLGALLGLAAPDEGEIEALVAEAKAGPRMSAARIRGIVDGVCADLAALAEAKAGAKRGEAKRGEAALAVEARAEAGSEAKRGASGADAQADHSRSRRGARGGRVPSVSPRLVPAAQGAGGAGGAAGADDVVVAAGAAGGVVVGAGGAVGPDGAVAAGGDEGSFPAATPVHPLEHIMEQTTDARVNVRRIMRRLYERDPGPYARKFMSHYDEKVDIAKRVNDEILGPEEVKTMYLGDGSGSSHCFIEHIDLRLVLDADLRARQEVYTTNLDVLTVLKQVGWLLDVKSPSKVWLPEGFINSNDNALYPFGTTSATDQTKQDPLAYFASLVDVCILSVSELDAEWGPCGGHPSSRAVKSTVLECAENLVIVADHTKLSRPHFSRRARTCNRHEWSNAWLKSKRDFLRVVVTLDCEFPCKVPADPPPPDDHHTAPDYWQRWNAAKLLEALGDNFMWRHVDDIKQQADTTSTGDAHAQ